MAKKPEMKFPPKAKPGAKPEKMPFGAKPEKPGMPAFKKGGKVKC